MFKTGKGKTQATTVVHEGKVYRGTMPNLNMKTDLTSSFEYIATIVEGMSSGNQNNNPVYNDFRQKIIDSTISGEVGRLIHERGHVPSNYNPSPHLGRYSSQISIARGPGNLDVSNLKVAHVPTPSPAAVGKSTDLIVKKMTKEEKEDERMEAAVHIDVGRGRIGSSDTPSMLELNKLFDEWEHRNPFAKRPNESAEKRLKRIDKEMNNISQKTSEAKTAVKRQKKLAEEIIKATRTAPKKKIAKKKTIKKAVAKKTTKKKTKKKVAKKRSNK